MNLEGLQPSFLDAVFRRGNIIARCGFCHSIHYCLDHPEEDFPEITDDLSPASPAAETSKDDIKAAIRGFEEQVDRGLNSCYDPEKLIHFIRNSEIDDELFGPTIEEKVAGIFRCSPAKGADLLNKFPSEATVRAVPHFGLENIQIGTIDSLPAVMGCCEARHKMYQKLFWSDRETIAEFLTNESAAMQKEADDEKAVSDKVNEAVKNNE